MGKQRRPGSSSADDRGTNQHQQVSWNLPVVAVLNHDVEATAPVKMLRLHVPRPASVWVKAIVEIRTRWLLYPATQKIQMANKSTNLRATTVLSRVIFRDVCM